MNASNDDIKAFRFDIGQIVRVCGEPSSRFVVFERKLTRRSGFLPQISYLVRVPFPEDPLFQSTFYENGVWIADNDLAAWKDQP
jgi:hypothetical protein